MDWIWGLREKKQVKDKHVGKWWYHLLNWGRLREEHVCEGKISGALVLDVFLFLFFKNLFILFILFLAALGLVCSAHGLSLVVASGGYSSLRCTGFSLRWLLLLQSTGSRRVGFSSCGTQAQ